MATTKTYNPMTDQFEYVSDGHVLLTAAEHKGIVTLPDGHEVDVTPHVVEVPSQLHAVQTAVHLAGGDAAAVTQEHVDALNAVADPAVEDTAQHRSLHNEVVALMQPDQPAGETSEVAE